MKRLYEESKNNCSFIVCPYREYRLDNLIYCYSQCPFHHDGNDNLGVYVDCSCPAPEWKTGEPGKNGKYLVLIEYDYDKELREELLAFYKDGWVIHLSRHQKIIAWMEIPEYKENPPKEATR